jgi:hypothetical protein
VQQGNSKGKHEIAGFEIHAVGGAKNRHSRLEGIVGSISHGPASSCHSYCSPGAHGISIHSFPARSMVTDP